MIRSSLTVMMIGAFSMSMMACKRGSTEREVSQVREGAREMRFGDYDLDRNGFLNDEELLKYDPDYAKNFGVMDSDRDMQVSEEEFRVYGERRARGD